MVYFTGDIHGSPWRVEEFCLKNKLTSADVIVILGDAGANYYGDYRDDCVKQILNMLGPTILCLHGNHEERPEHIDGYALVEWNGGKVWRQEAYPRLLFARDGEIFDIDGLRYLVIGGAYSVDKYYRLERGLSWWADEQPSAKIKALVEQQITEERFDVILSHTCPFKYEPVEMFIGGIDQSRVDKSTELWLDAIEDRVDYLAWFCGHWHTDKRVDRMHFLFNSFETEEEIKR